MLKQIVWGLLFLASSASFAAPPNFVYRVDTRGPDVIFDEGFLAWGNNHNIVAHINGATCSTDGSTSAFISTAADRDAALGIVRQYLSQGRTAYLYTIRADDNFYSGPQSIDYLQPFARSPLSIMSLEMARRADEWDAISAIPSANIREVAEYQPTGEIENHSNAQYVNIDTTGNPSPYTEHSEETLAHYGFTMEENNSTSSLGACFLSCFGVRQSDSQLKGNVSTNSVCATSGEQIINFNTTTLKILQQKGKKS